jgi:glycosyltransferase involved in cell wall biosynthesis
MPDFREANAVWICAQIGAREHFAIPRALAAKGVLNRLITDAWVPPRSLPARISGQKSEVRGRFHQDLSHARVTAFGSSLLQFELLAHLRRLHGWDRTIARNEWFQRKAVAALTSDLRFESPASPPTALRPTSGSPVLFAYSYAALEILRYAKTRGWRTVLGQIDPGPAEEEIVAEEVGREPALGAQWQPAPTKYWSDWREECAIADRVVVNSQWSRSCLVEAGVDGSKLFVIPLAYEMPEVRGQTSEIRRERQYPDRFDEQRPLRVLFLGQINLRKGVARLLKAVRLLQNEPVEFRFVGPVQLSVPDDLKNNPKVHWVGIVPRSEVSAFYQNADLLIFPTLSDGFGLTQLEAQAWSLPVLASRFCGQVVDDGVNGIVLDELSPDAIAAALRSCLRDPERLRTFSTNTITSNSFNLKAVAQSLLGLFDGAD